MKGVKTSILPSEPVIEIGTLVIDPETFDPIQYSVSVPVSGATALPILRTYDDVQQEIIGNYTIPAAPQFSPLFGGHLLIRIDLAPPAPGSPVPPAWVVVSPFTPEESLQYINAVDNHPEKSPERLSEQQKRLTERIKEWNSITGTEAAPINRGTVSRVPLWALTQIEDAVFAEGGNWQGCSGRFGGTPNGLACAATVPSG